MKLGAYSETRVAGANAQHAWERLRRIGREDPVWWIENVLGVKLYKRQREVVEAFRRNPRVSVRSGHGVGKDFVAACIGAWWILVDDGMVLMTAPKWSQIEDIYFATLKRVVYNSKVPLIGEWNRANEIQKTSWELGPLHGVYGVNASEPVRVQGYHHPRTLVLVDESSGVPDEMVTALQGALSYSSGNSARELHLGNPTEVTGHFAETFREGSGWVNIHISCLDSPNITGECEIPGLATMEYVEAMKKEYGEGSNTYRVHVLGEFPLEGAVDRVIPETVLVKSIGFAPKVLVAADGAPVNYVVQGFDVARFGDNKTVSVILKNGIVMDAEGVQGYDTIQAAQWGMSRAEYFKAHVTAVDTTGMGAGVFDQMKSKGANVLAVDFARNAGRSEVYDNLRAEMAFNLSEALRDEKLGLSPGLPRIVLDDMREMRYKHQQKTGRLLLEDKHETRRRIGRSPDYSDGVMLAWYAHDKGRDNTPTERARKDLNKFFSRYDKLSPVGDTRF
jgi:hypothetical protein